MKTTAERLQEIMRERNLKQADVIELAKPFADRYGAKLTRPDMSQYCSGKVAPTQKKLFLLAAALDVDEGWLMGYDVEKARKQRFQVNIEDSPFMRALGNGEHQEMFEEYRRHYFDRSITDDERAIISAYRAADTRTQRMIAYMLKLEDLTDADR